MATNPHANVAPFDADIEDQGHYAYSENARLSARFAHGHITQWIEHMVSLLEGDSSLRVADIGSGDGFFSAKLADNKPRRQVVGLDASALAVQRARQKYADLDSRLTFEEGSAYELPWSDDSFDVAILRAILHHLDEPAQAVAEALRVAPLVIVLEPNGNSSILKVIEKISPYHRKHREKSYNDRQIARMVKFAHGRIVCRKIIGFVPTFCPDWMARICKFLEPIAEAIPGLRRTLGAQYVLLITRMPEWESQARILTSRSSTVAEMLGAPAHSPANHSTTPARNGRLHQKSDNSNWASSSTTIHDK